MRKSFNTEFIAKVALEAIKAEKTLAALPSQYEVHRTQIAKWRKRAIEGFGGIFQGKAAKTIGEKEKVINELYRQIGKLKVENEWLKKKLCRLSVDEKKRLIELDNKGLSVRRQCEIVGLNRSNWYYEPGAATDETVRFMHRVDEIFTECPFFGSRRIQETLGHAGIV
jgi:putative transposase